MIPTLSRFLHRQEFLKRRRASSEHGTRDLVLSEVEGGAVNAACLLRRFWSPYCRGSGVESRS